MEIAADPEAVFVMPTFDDNYARTYISRFFLLKPYFDLG